MPKNTILSTWVKNVYSLCVQGVQTSAQSYTPQGTLAYNPVSMWVQAPRYTQVMDIYPLSEYTAKFRILPLVITRLYTVSTAPTITEGKEKIRKDS